MKKLLMIVSNSVWKIEDAYSRQGEYSIVQSKLSTQQNKTWKIRFADVIFLSLTCSLNSRTYLPATNLCKDPPGFSDSEEGKLTIY